MVDSFTPNRNIIQPLVGGDTGTWGTLLNSGVAGQLDNVLGNTQPITITVADITLSTDQWNHCAIKLAGALTGNRNLKLPFAVGSVTVGVGGLFVVDNRTTGNFNVTVKTVAAGSNGVVVLQGVKTYLYSDGTNVYYADDSKLTLIPSDGDPNGSIAGTAASFGTPPSVVWDYTNLILYVCTTTGNAAAAVWTNSAATSTTISGLQGYLTPTSNVPIITTDVIGSNTIFYTPFIGNQAAIHNGTAWTPYTFTQKKLTLSPSQAANNIYDIFLAYNGGTPVIGTGPSWSAGGGSIVPGSGARGTGAGSTELTRDATTGLWSNANNMNLIWNTGTGNTTIVVPAGQGLYLGSIYVDATAGQVTCHRLQGRNRKWGVSNAYNRQNINLIVSDPTASWTYSLNTWRASRGVPASFTNNEFNAGSGTLCNGAIAFMGLAEEEISVAFSQQISPVSNSATDRVAQASIGIGVNSTTAPSGMDASVFASVFSGTTTDLKLTGFSQDVELPNLGLTVLCCLEKQDSATSGASLFWGALGMQMTVSFRA